MGDNTPEPESVSRRVARGTGWVVAWRMATRNLGLLSTLALVRLLRPEDFGLVALATGFANAVDSLSMIGVQDALIRETRPDRDMYDTAFGLNALRGILTAVIILAIAWPTAAFFAEPRLVPVMVVLAGAMLLSAFDNIGTVDFRRDFAFDKEFTLQIVPRAIGVVATVGLALLWHSYWALIVGLAIWRLARLVQSYVMSPYRPRFRLVAWRRLIGFSLWTWLLTVLMQVKERGDSAVIGRIMGTAQFGVFSIGAEFGALTVTELVEPLSRTLFSGFSLLHRNDESPTRLYLGAVATSVMLVLPAGLGISMVADPMVQLVLGSRWLSAVPIMEIIAVASPLAVFGNFSGVFLAARGEPRTTFMVSLVSVAIRIPLMIVLVHGWGLWGGALGVAIATAIDQGLFLSWTMRHLGITILDLWISTWRPIVASAAMAACLYALDLAWTPAVSEGWRLAGELALRCGLGAAVYAAALLLAWVLCGRPDGIEHQMLTVARAWVRARFARIQGQSRG